MYLFFDTETTGVPKNYKAPLTDLANWPRAVQIAWAIYDSNGTETGAVEHLIRPDGFTIPAEVTAIHGITTAQALEKGIALTQALSEFWAAVQTAQTLVGHNISFDENILGAEFLRCKMDNPIPSKPRICTMKASVNYCKLPGTSGYKNPKLGELYKILFQTHIEQAHTALADVRATARCFFQLKELGIITRDKQR